MGIRWRGNNKKQHEDGRYFDLYRAPSFPHCWDGAGSMTTEIWLLWR